MGSVRVKGEEDKRDRGETTLARDQSGTANKGDDEWCVSDSQLSIRT